MTSQKPTKTEAVERRLKSKFWARCMYIQCPECTKVELGVGMHLVEVYEIIKFHDAVKCIDCRGSGTQKTECHVCDGTGQVSEPCTTCDGNGVLVDYSCEEGGEPEVLGITSVLVKEKK